MRYTTSMGIVVREVFGVNATVHSLPIMWQRGGNGDGYPEDVMVLGSDAHDPLHLMDEQLLSPRACWSSVYDTAYSIV